jgi:hypothetical protein
MKARKESVVTSVFSTIAATAATGDITALQAIDINSGWPV